MQKRHKRMAIIIVVSFFYFLSIYLLMGGLCVFKGIFGLPCPACGSTRAMLLLAKGDVKGCMELNPAAPLLFLCLLNEIRVNYFAKGNKKIAGILLIVSVAAAVIIYIIRMNLYFPYKEPYVYNHDCLLIQFLKIVENI